MKTLNRRDFLKRSTALAAGAGLLGAGYPASAFAGVRRNDDLYRISIAEWSLHRTIRGGELDHLDFARVTRQEFGLDAVEYVNQFFMDRAQDTAYLNEMKTRAEGEGVRSLLIMCDGEGRLGDPDEAKRLQAVENHYKWVEAARFLGCHSIRVNAYSEGSYEEQMERVADGLRRLCEFADEHEINVIVENHGGLSSNAVWLVGVMEKVDHPRVGTLPDFGNFRIRSEPEEWYDRYKGVAEMMPYAKAVSAKSHEFDEDGNEVRTDYLKMMQIVLDAGYRGYVGIEYEGDQLGEMEGIRATRDLLLRVREQLADNYREKAKGND